MLHTCDGLQHDSWNVAVVNIGRECCHLKDERIFVPLERGYIASSVLPSPECGEATCPLVIQAAVGQQINMSIYNFNISSVGMWHFAIYFARAWFGLKDTLGYVGCAFCKNKWYHQLWLVVFLLIVGSVFSSYMSNIFTYGSITGHISNT